MLSLTYTEKQFLKQLIYCRKLIVAKGYDLSEKLSYRLMQGRLGIYDKYHSHDTVLDPKLRGVKNQDMRLNHQGGSTQQKRMIADKLRSLDRAVHYSYQGADVKKVDSTASHSVRALINPNKLKPDYDDKIISIRYDHDFSTGDIFEWVGTNTHWLIYLQDLTELAYFRGDIRKCSHEIAWEDEEGLHKTYAAIRGPVETKINFIQKHGISVDTPNYSLHILMPKTESAVKYFQRYSKFYLQGDEDYKICWRVEAADWISMPGILEITAVEYYANEIEDDIEQGIVGGLIADPINPNNQFIEDTITGETFIKPHKTYIFTYVGNYKGIWSVDKNVPVELKQNGKSVEVRWTDTFSGQFDLYYGGIYKKTVVVESLF